MLLDRVVSMQIESVECNGRCHANVCRVDVRVLMAGFAQW